MAEAGYGRGKHPNSQKNLLGVIGEPNTGNRGGGNMTVEARETKQGFLDAINGAVVKVKDKTADGAEVEREIVVSEGFKRVVIGNLLDPSPKLAGFHQWWAEFMHGKPNVKMELLLSEGQLFQAVALALHEEAVDAEIIERVLLKINAILAASPE